MSIDLAKRTAAAEAGIVNLLKREAGKGVDLGEVTAQVVLVVDFSGSMTPRFKNGEVQATVERSLAMALAGLDDDGTVQTVFFDHRAFSPTEVTEQSYIGFVDEFYRKNQMGRTAYVPAINAVLGMFRPGMSKGILRKKAAVDAMLRSDLPTFVLFVTDGEPSDKDATKQLLHESAQLPIFWQFLGLGYAPAFLAELDTMPGRVVDNVGLLDMADTLHMDDVAFHEAVLDEYLTSWTPAARTAGVIRSG